MSLDSNKQISARRCSLVTVLTERLAIVILERRPLQTDSTAPESVSE